MTASTLPTPAAQLLLQQTTVWEPLASWYMAVGMRRLLETTD